MSFSPLKSSFAVLLLAALLLFGVFVDRSLAQSAKKRGSDSDLNVQNPFSVRATRDAATSFAATPKLIPIEKPSDSNSRADVLFSTSGERFVGTVEKISGFSGVSFRLSGSQSSQTIPTTEIERIETPVDVQFQQGVSSFERGRRSGDAADFRQALAAFQAARQAETRPWVREWTTAKIVESFLALGRGDDAANEFFLLARTDPYTAFLSSIPLRWTNRTSFQRAIATSADGASTEKETARWLAPKSPTGEPNPVGRLLAASILLNSATYKKDAISALQDLDDCRPSDAAPNAAPESNVDVDSATSDAARTCRTISLLATAQLWRLALLKTPTEREVVRWEKTLALFPTESRIGPTFLVARADAALQRDDAALRAFLQVAFLSIDRDLAEESAKNAVDAFERLGKNEDAARLRADSARRFAQ